MLEEKTKCKLQTGNLFLPELSVIFPTCQLLPLWKAEATKVQEVLSLTLKHVFISLGTFQNPSFVFPTI